MRLHLIACITVAAATVANPSPCHSHGVTSTPDGNFSSIDAINFRAAHEFKIIDRGRIVRNYKKRLRKKLNLIDDHLIHNRPSLYTRDLTQTELEQTRDGMLDILKGISEMERSEVVYKVFYDARGDSIPGETIMDVSARVILIRYPHDYDGKALIGHEIWHGIEYERGKISFLRIDGTGGTLCDITDEAEAYRRMFLSHIDIRFTKGINDDSTRRISKAYLYLRAGPIDLDSPVGKALRDKTIDEGKGHVPNSEFYIGWELDYKKGIDSAGKQATPPI